MCENLANVGKLRPRVGVRLPAKPDQFGNVFVAKDFLLATTRLFGGRLLINLKLLLK